MSNNSYCLSKAIEITQASASAGGSNLAGVLRTVYEEIKKLELEVEQEG